MAITSRDTLKTAIADWLDDQTLSAYLDDFIAFAENDFNRDIRHRKMIETTSLTPTSNVCTVPSDFLEAIRVVEKASIRRELDYLTASAADQVYPSRPAGTSVHYTLIGDRLTALPLSTNDIELTYFQKIPALTSSNTSNWLLTASPSLYLHGAIIHAMRFKGDGQSPMFVASVQMAKKLVDDLNAERMAEYHRAGVNLKIYTP